MGRTDFTDFEMLDAMIASALKRLLEMPSDVILEGLYKSEFQDSVQLQTVLALYDQETVRNNGQLCYLFKIEDSCKTSYWSND